MTTTNPNPAYEQTVSKLLELFPNMGLESLRGIVKSVKGSLDAAVQLILGSQSDTEHSSPARNPLPPKSRPTPPPPRVPTPSEQLESVAAQTDTLRDELERLRAAADSPAPATPTGAELSRMHKQSLRISEDLMKSLLTLDAVDSQDPEIRACRRTQVKDIQRVMDEVDDVGQSLKLSLQQCQQPAAATDDGGQRVSTPKKARLHTPSTAAPNTSAASPKPSAPPDDPYAETIDQIAEFIPSASRDDIRGTLILCGGNMQDAVESLLAQIDNVP
eukprot:TRINITY_DN6287_c0_g1_i1.p1 TRINITY_DN6287_c0_g1~~TRINITY_DN6287_c0_g1_i1.p1  ORF type:complete len:274 (+),score=54.83 TRINITY_DN6287_c0_g1_i1:83-904(+)